MPRTDSASTSCWPSTGPPGRVAGTPPTSASTADAEAQLAARFALFQLRSHAGRHDELAVGARGLTGPGYSGHVFWDADVFVLPALAAIDPAAARAMLRTATSASRRGPHEPRHGPAGPAPDSRGSRRPTAATSLPASGRRRGRVIPVRTGELEEHITADVAWAVAYSAPSGTGDGRSPAGSPEAELLVETARYWAQPLRPGRRRPRATSYHVIGPDEYHEDVDDNAFTNVMARWNLRARRATLRRTATPTSWLDAALAALVDGYDAGTGLYEQFAGYFGLEPLLVARLRAGAGGRGRAARPGSARRLPR